MKNSAQLNSWSMHQGQQSPEDVRSVVSDHLTNILLLIGRLDNSNNVRNLPVTLGLLTPHLSKFKSLELSSEAFPDILRENIYIREKHSRVFSIPASLRRDPKLNGILYTVHKLCDSNIRRFIDEERKFLAGEIHSNKEKRVKAEALTKTIKNLLILSEFCSMGNRVHLQNMSTWCEFERSALS